MEQSQSNKIWIVVFIACFLGLLVDGMDLQMLSLSMPSLMDEFKINKTTAGLISTWSLIGMAIGGIVGGWLSDRFGRVRMATYMLVLFSIGTSLLRLSANIPAIYRHPIYFCNRDWGRIFHRHDAYG